MNKSLVWRAAIFFACAIALAFTFFALAVFFVTTHAGQNLDQRAFNGAFLGQRSVAPVTLSLLDALPITGVAVAVILAIVVTVVRRNGGVLFVALVTALLANVMTQVIKHILLVRPDLGVPGYALNSLPSGHTTIAASSVLVVFLVCSQRVRPIVAAVGAIFIAGVGISTLANQWHRPSDVIASMLLVAVFGCLAGFALIWFRFTNETQEHDVLNRVLLLLALPFAGLAVATLLVAAFEPFAYIGAAAGVVTCSLLLAAASNHAFRFIR